MRISINTLADLRVGLLPDATLLEDGSGFARWDLGQDESGWFCLVCGERVETPRGGCPLCGNGTEYQEHGHE